MKAVAIRFLESWGIQPLVPLIKLVTGEKPKEQLDAITRLIGLPLIGILLFLAAWHIAASSVTTSLGQLPGPAQAWQQAQALYTEHVEIREKEAAFYERQEKRNAKKLAKNPDAKIKVREYTGKESFIDQIWTSLGTVFVGFILGSLIAIPIGVACGMNQSLYGAVSPLIQMLKPISPLAWLPIVTMVVSAVYVSDDPLFAKSFITSAITVTLCSLWPTLINTAIGVSSIDKDWLNVGRVIRLPWHAQVTKIALPAALPSIFTGLRISLGIGWMVLIAAEMLAQNPGLGKFIWDEFQNGSSNSLGRIMVAVIVIGMIGYFLDWMMLTLQRLITRSPSNEAR